MTPEQRAKKTGAILAKAADNLGLDVVVDRQDVDSQQVPSVILMHDRDVSYSIEVPVNEDGTFTLGMGGGLGPNAWHRDLGTADKIHDAVEELLTKRASQVIRNSVRYAGIWYDKREDKS